MKTEYSRARNCWGAMLIAASILGACGQVEEGTGPEEGVMEEQQALTGVVLGMSVGNMHTGVIEPLSTHSEQVMCELSGLGAKWLRIEADVATTDATTYRRIIEKAHAKQMQVLVTVPAKYCGADNDQAAIDAFTAAYVSHLNDLTANVFTGTGMPDAYEIGSNPNITENNCADSVSRYRVGPNAFAWLLRKAWDWKQQNGPHGADRQRRHPQRVPDHQPGHHSGHVLERPVQLAGLRLGQLEDPPVQLPGRPAVQRQQDGLQLHQLGQHHVLHPVEEQREGGPAGGRHAGEHRHGHHGHEALRHPSSFRSPRRTSAWAVRTSAAHRPTASVAVPRTAARGGHECRGRSAREQRRDAPSQS